MAAHKKTLQQFHHDLGWSTRMYILLALTVATGLVVFQHWGLIIAFALVIILFAEALSLSIYRHPATWRAIGWVLFLLALAMLLIGLSL